MGFATKPVLVVDIVEFSKRRGTNQMDAVQALIQLLGKTIPEEYIDSKRIIWGPAGDGGALTFWGTDLYTALETAIALGKHIDQYNKGELELHDVQTGRLLTEPFRVRMGIHSGPVSKEVDFDKRENVWGPGVNMAARVASLARPDQIVASYDYCKQAELLDDPDIVLIGKWWAKHNISVMLYNVYKDGVGLPSEEVGEWFGPFQYPLQLAISTYSAMAQEEIEAGEKAFRVLVLAKRLLDLNPRYQQATEWIKSISVVTPEFRKVGERILYDDFFSRLSPDALLYFFQNAYFVDFQKDGFVFKQGSKADSMMMIVSGEMGLMLGGQKTDIVLREGDVIGEMGLFNPVGEKRTATLKASKSTIALRLDYEYLRLRNDEASEVEEIRKQIWRYYCDRMSQNLIESHHLFKHLSNEQRKELLNIKEFLPRHYDESIHLEVNDLWENWILVVEGKVSIHTKDGKRVEFSRGDCIGPIRVVVSKSPYAEVEVSPNAHLVRLPWEKIKDLRSECKSFRRECVLEGDDARERMEVEL